MKPIKLGEALVEAGLITRQELNLALERQVTFGGSIGTNLLELRILNEEEFTNFLSKYFKVPAVTNEMITSIPEEALHSISKEIVEKYKILPLKKELKRLHFAMLNPKNVEMIDELRFMTGLDIIPYVIAELRLFYALEKYYGIKTDRRYIRYLDRYKIETEVTDSIDRIKLNLTKVNNAEEVAETLLRAASTIANRVAIFIIKDGQIIPWKARGLDTEGFKMLKEEHSIFSEVIKSKNFYRGPLHDMQGNAPLIKVLSGTPQDVLITPIAIRENVVALLYIDNGNESVLDANVIYLSKLASMASIALEILKLKEKISEL
jgi:hypothetical protein